MCADVVLRRYFHAPSCAPRAAQIIAAAGLAEELAVIDDHFAARKHRAGVALHLVAFEHRVVDAHVMGLRADGVDARLGSQMTMSASLPGAISPFLRIHAEDARGRGGGDLDEAVQRELARHSRRDDR